MMAFFNYSSKLVGLSRADKMDLNVGDPWSPKYVRLR